MIQHYEHRAVGIKRWEAVVKLARGGVAEREAAAAGRAERGCAARRPAHAAQRPKIERFCWKTDGAGSESLQHHDGAALYSVNVLRNVGKRCLSRAVKRNREPGLELAPEPRGPGL